MYVLGIETSCDETAASIVVDGTRVLSNEVTSSLEFHKRFGGIIPEIAFRMHLETISAVTKAAIEDAGITPAKIGLISVTNGPGLLGSLFVGVSFAKALSMRLKVPLIGVNHIYSHIYAALLDNNCIKRPFVALVVSGGHTSLFYVKDFNSIHVLGSTQDDACGEAFDKVAKILGLGYPGGPLIEKLAARGDSRKIKFRCSGTKAALDFSFSGIKTAVLYTVKPVTPKHKGLFGAPPSAGDIAASFQKSVIDTLIDKSLLALKAKKADRLVVGGGVVANTALRQEFSRRCTQEGVEVFFPSRALSTDNAAMVAGLGYALFKKGIVSDLSLSPDLN